MKTEQRPTKASVSYAKGKTVRGLSMKSGITANKGTKQRRNSAGNKLVSLQTEQQNQTKTSNAVWENGEELSGQCLLSPTVSLSHAISTSMPKQSSLCFQKFKLQLFPLDEVTHRGLEMEKHNPYLELTIGPRKKISSVVKHLNIKWGKPKMASGELMLFPYDAGMENLTSHTKWTLKDSDIRATDVHVAIGSPAIFRLRYGWLSDIEPEKGRMPLISQLPENDLPNVHDTKTTTDYDKHLCHMETQDRGPAPADVSSNQGFDKPIQLDKADQPLKNNQSTANTSALFWDISNISFGALLSEASRNANTSHITCDSFDAAISRFQSTIQSTHVPQTSILDAEETCNAFCFQKITSSSGRAPNQSQDAPVASCVQNASTRLHDVSQLNSQAGHIHDNTDLQSACSRQLHTNDEACRQSIVDLQHLTQDVVSEGPMSEAPTGAHSDTGQIGKLDTYWPESLGHSEFVAPSSKLFVGGDSIGLDGLIVSSLDAFQNFSIF